MRPDADREREHGHGPSSVAVMPRVSGFSGAALRKLDPVWASALRRVDGEARVLQQLAEGEFEVAHGLERSEILPPSRRSGAMARREGGKSDIGHLESKIAPAPARWLHSVKCQIFDARFPMTDFLLITKRLHRIDARRAARRQPAGQQRHPASISGTVA